MESPTAGSTAEAAVFTTSIAGVFVPVTVSVVLRQQEMDFSIVHNV